MGPAGVINCTPLSSLSSWVSLFPGTHGYNRTNSRSARYQMSFGLFSDAPDQFSFPGLPSPGVTEQFREGQWEVGLWASLCTQGCVPLNRWPEHLWSGRSLASCWRKLPHLFPLMRIPRKRPKFHIRVPRVQSGMFSPTHKKWSLFFFDSLSQPQVFLFLWIFIFIFKAALLHGIHFIALQTHLRSIIW